MAAQGLDAAEPPPAAKAKQMLDAIHGRWWNVYIGGSFATRIWSPSHVREYVQHGIRRFMLTYVGQQHGGEWHGTLTRERGLRDGREALEQARSFGYSGGVPLCLDIERPTFESRRTGMIEYARAWCEAVRAGGARPGIYANPEPLVAMHQGGVRADFVWIASWVTRHPGPHDPHSAIRGLPANLWSRPGQRAWQYAGAQNGTPCTVLGVDVDVSVSDLGCLAPPPGAVAKRAKGGAVARRRPAVHRKAQHDGALSPSPRRRAGSDRAVAPPAPRAGAQAPTLPQLVEQFQRLDAETERAWQRIEDYGRRSRRLLARAEAERQDGLPGIAASLRGIEHHLADLVDAEERELALAEHPTSPLAPAAHAADPPEGAAPAATTSAAGAPAAPTPSSAPQLADLPTAQLEARIHTLEDDLDRSRRERIARYARVEKRLRTEARGTTVEQLVTSRPAVARPAAAARRRRPRAAGPRGRAPAHAEDASSLQRSLNRFTQEFLRGIPPLRVDGVKGRETNKRVQTAKLYLGYRADARDATVTPEFVRRLRNPRSLRYANADTLARAARRRRRQRRDAARLDHVPIEGTPKHVIDAIVLPIAASCGIHLTPADVVVRNREHRLITTAGRRSDHKGPPTYAWAADMSNGSSPTPQMDELARRIARRLGIPWNGAGEVTAHGHGYRFQLFYRVPDHLDHVHFGLRVE
jgi:hypothetical protein